MRIRPTVLVMAAALAFPVAARAQTVRGRVLDDSTGVPIGLVEVRLLDVHGTQRGGAVSADDGAFTIIVPDSGLYRLHATRLGYDSVTCTAASSLCLSRRPGAA